MALWSVENIGEITKPKVDVISIVLSAFGFSGIIYSLTILSEEPFFLLLYGCHLPLV